MLTQLIVTIYVSDIVFASFFFPSILKITYLADINNINKGTIISESGTICQLIKVPV